MQTQSSSTPSTHSTVSKGSSSEKKSLWEKVKYQFTFQTEDFGHFVGTWGWGAVMMTFVASNIFFSFTSDGRESGLYMALAIWQLSYTALFLINQSTNRSQREMIKDYGELLDSQFAFSDDLIKDNVQLRKENVHLREELLRLKQ